MSEQEFKDMQEVLALGGKVQRSVVIACCIVVMLSCQRIEGKASFTEEQAVVFVAKSLTFPQFQEILSQTPIEKESDENRQIVIAHLYLDCKNQYQDVIDSLHFSPKFPYKFKLIQYFLALYTYLKSKADFLKKNKELEPRLMQFEDNRSTAIILI